MNKELMRLAINLLDNPNGIAITTYDLLKAVLKADGSHDARELIDNVQIVGDVAFLDETWVEENYAKFE